MDGIIDRSIATNDRTGYFAYLYRRVTAEILKEVQLGNFEDNDRMEVFDVAFANYYLDAYNAHTNHTEIGLAWDYAFNSKTESLTILQHLLLGVNVHINLDLALTATTVMKDTQISLIESDFMKVNAILGAMVNEMQDRLSKVSPLLFLLDVLGKNTDEKIINFSLEKAREFSWAHANLLWGMGSNHQISAIKEMDRAVLQWGMFIKDPKSKFIGYALNFISMFEEKQVGKVISKLREDS